MAQKTILQIAQAVAAELNTPQPQVVISAQDANIVKLLSLVRATADDLLAEYDWQFLQTRYSFSTTIGVDNYPLPSDAERFINGTFFDSTNRWPLPGPLTATQWEVLKNQTISSGPFSRYRIYQNKFWITPAPASATYTFALEYVSRNYVQDGSTGALKPDFTQDSDIALFDHRLLVYGTKYKWQQSIGADTTASLANFNRALEFAKGSDSPAQRLSIFGATTVPMLSPANLPDGNWH